MLAPILPQERQLSWQKNRQLSCHHGSRHAQIVTVLDCLHRNTKRNRRRSRVCGRAPARVAVGVWRG